MLVTLAAAILALAPSASDPAADEGPGVSPTWRVGGDLFATVARRGDDYVCPPLAVTTALPEGYPQPTPPGAIEIKVYPSVRRAQVTGADVPADRGMNMAFWPLFQHIRRNEIAMTSPVEMDYHANEEGNGAGAAPSWTMSFLYRTPDLRETGREGSVQIVDTKPVTVLSIGIRGSYASATVERGLEELDLWLAANPEWERAGEPRALFYNGPDTKRANLWGEAQAPIRRKGGA